jgi:DNA-binding IscR family transcriptional regulator
MNRRQFGKMVVGSGFATAIPLNAASASFLNGAKRSKYIFAVALAHNRVNVTPDMIADAFKVQPSIAGRLLSQLVKNGVVDPPNAQGIATLAKPLQRIVPQVVEANSAGGYFVKGRLEELMVKAEDVTKQLLSEEQTDDVKEVSSSAADF